MQLYCPACENVVEVDAENQQLDFCPMCAQRITAPGKKTRITRKREASADEQKDSADARVVAAGTLTRIQSPAEAESAPSEHAEAQEQEAEEFRLNWQEAAPRYVALPYRADGGLNGWRLPLLLVYLLLVAAFLGYLVSSFGQWLYLVFLYPLALGITLASLLGAGCRWARLRNPTVAGLIAVLAALVTMAVMHFRDYTAAQHAWARNAQAIPQPVRGSLEAGEGFLAYLDAHARWGLVISDGSDVTLPLGYFGTWVYWFGEVLLVVLLAVLTARQATMQPFCRNCGQWKRERFVGRVRPRAELIPHLRRGRLTELAGSGCAEGEAGLVIRLISCWHCGVEAPVEVFLDGEPPTARVHLSFPGEAYPSLEEIGHGCLRKSKLIRQ